MKSGAPLLGLAKYIYYSSMSKEQKGCLDYVEDYEYLGVGAKNLHHNEKENNKIEGNINIVLDGIKKIDGKY